MKYNHILVKTLSDGGGTFLSADDSEVTHGFAVGNADGSFAVVSPYDHAAFDANIDAVRANAGAYGTWYDSGLIHIDPVSIVDNVGNADTLARANHQLAYYDLDDKKEIRTNV